MNSEINTSKKPGSILEVREYKSLLSWLSSVDHKQIGIMYITTSLLFFLAGVSLAMIMRTQLIKPNHHWLSPETYNQVFTMHGTTMVFLAIMPMLTGFMVYFTPLMIGARDVSFPRMNALSYWLYLMGGLLIYFSYFTGDTLHAGWSAYAPLTSVNYSMNKYLVGTGVDYWIVGLLLTGAGTIMTAINILVTVADLRAPDMKLTRIPLFVWMSSINAVLMLLALPALNAALVMLFMDRHLNALFFNPAAGGNPLLWEHSFWFFGHPEVYILILPGFGIVSEVIPVFSRKPIFGYAFMAVATVAIGFLSFGVWAHHMFATGMNFTVYYVFALSTVLIAVPTGIKIFNWIATMWGGSISFDTAMLFCRCLHHPVHDRRPERSGFRHRAHRLGAYPHLFRGGPFSLHPAGRHYFHRDGRILLLVPENHRPHAVGKAGQDTILAHGVRLQRHVFHSSLRRARRHAAQGLYVPRFAASRNHQPDILSFCLRPWAGNSGLFR